MCFISVLASKFSSCSDPGKPGNPKVFGAPFILQNGMFFLVDMVVFRGENPPQISSSSRTMKDIMKVGEGAFYLQGFVNIFSMIFGGSQPLGKFKKNNMMKTLEAPLNSLDFIYTGAFSHVGTSKRG